MRTLRYQFATIWKPCFRIALIVLSAFLLLACVQPAPRAVAQEDRVSQQLDLNVTYSSRYVYVYVPPGLVELSELRDALQQSFGCALPDDSFSTTSSAYRTQWLPDLFRWHGLTEDVEVRTAPLLRFAENHNLDWVTITFNPYAERTNTVEPSVYEERSRKSNYSYIAIPVGHSESAPASYRCSSGFRPAQLMMALAAMTTPTVIALLLLLRLHRVMKRRSPDELADSLFGYARFTSNVILFMWGATAWWFALAGGSLVGDIVGKGNAEIGYAVGAIAAWIVPFLGQLAISALFYPQLFRLRGAEWSRGELVLQSAWAWACIVLPVTFTSTMIGAAISHEYRRSVAWLVLAVVSVVFCAARWRSASQYSPDAVSSGELRDVIFGLAERAQVKLQQIYLYATGKGKLANAYAVSNNNVLLTDYLLDHLSKREIAAVMAHEIAHLQYGHPKQLLRVFLLATFVPLIAFACYVLFRYPVGETAPAIANPAQWLPVAILFGLQCRNSVSRRFERVADTGAVGLSGDPEALITGLLKTNRLNHVPNVWGKWTERTITHPATETRAREIAAQAGISEERLQELIANPEADQERFKAHGAGRSRIFSTLARGLLRSRSQLLQLASVLLPLALAAVAGQSAHLQAAALGACWAAGIAGSIAAYLVAVNYGSAPGLDRLRRELAARLSSEGCNVDDQYRFVLLSPDAEPRYYDNATFWDAGFMRLDGSGLTYAGENTAFTLRGDQIRSCRVRSGWPGWLTGPLLQLHWRPSETGAEGDLLVCAADRPTVLQNAAQTVELARKINEIIKSSAQDGIRASAADGLGAPAIGPVTSKSVRQAVRPAFVIASLAEMPIYAAVLSALLGLSFLPSEGNAALYLMLVALALRMAQWLPYLFNANSKAASRQY